jgi:NAD(P)-dependent dehydrogenase (short-subunit alcohol dehydrogenase family)
MEERALVTGATSGIGRAIVIRLARRGATVAVVGRNRAAADTVAREVEAAGGRAHVSITDVSKPGEVEAAVAGFVAACGGLDTVVASAGIAVGGSVTDCTLEDWDRLMATNLNGAFYLARYTIPFLIQSRGTFTAISSDAGVQAAAGFAAYIASKHALNGMVKSMALDYGKHGVRCNAVCPAFVETPMADALLKDASAAELAYYRGIVPLGRFATPDEVAAAVAHITSSEASYVNGLMYRLDGGSTAGYYLGTP